MRGWPRARIRFDRVADLDDKKSSTLEALLDAIRVVAERSTEESGERLANCGSAAKDFAEAYSLITVPILAVVDDSEIVS